MGISFGSTKAGGIAIGDTLAGGIAIGSNLVFLASAIISEIVGTTYARTSEGYTNKYTKTGGANSTIIDANGRLHKCKDGEIRTGNMVRVENLFANTGAPVTQDITVEVGKTYTVSLSSGSITLSGAATGTVTTELTFTATTETLTCTLSGTVTEPQLEIGDTASVYVEVDEEVFPKSLMYSYNTNLLSTGSENPTPTIVGSAGVSDTEAKFGTRSLHVDGKNDYIRYSNYDFGAGDFTLEFWFKPSIGGEVNGHYHGILQFGSASATNGGAGGFSILYRNVSDTVSNITFNKGTSAKQSSTFPTTVAVEWMHISINRVGGNLLAYINGVSIGSLSDSGFNPVGLLELGHYYDSPAYKIRERDMYIDDLTLVKGVAVRNGNFTPPNTEQTLPLVPNTYPYGANGVMYFTPDVSVGDPYTLLEDAGTNLFLNSDAVATQTITVTDTEQYTISVSGSGSLTLSGAATGTVDESAPVTVTASSTSLTLTLTGSLDYAQVELGTIASSLILTAGSAVTRTQELLTFDASSAPIPTNFSILIDAEVLDTDTDLPLVTIEDGNNTGYEPSVYSGSVTDITNTLPLAVIDKTTLTGRQKLGFTVNNSTQAIYKNGSGLLAETNTYAAATPALNTVRIGHDDTTHMPMKLYDFGLFDSQSSSTMNNLTS